LDAGEEISQLEGGTGNSGLNRRIEK
jgi:hypothetical protein